MTGPVPDRPWRFTTCCGWLVYAAFLAALVALAVALWGKP